MCLEMYGGRLSLFLFTALKLLNCTLILKTVTSPRVSLRISVFVYDIYIYTMRAGYRCYSLETQTSCTKIVSQIWRKCFCLSNYLVPLSLKGSLTLAMGKCLWFSVKINVCQSSLSSP